jgi:hypothetical protein
MNEATKFRLDQLMKGQAAEHEAFHSLMKIIPKHLEDEIVTLWTKGTSGAADESYYRRLMMSELSEAEYGEVQALAHNAWRILMGF